MLKHSRIYPRKKGWTMRYLRWLQEQQFDHPRGHVHAYCENGVPCAFESFEEPIANAALTTDQGLMIYFMLSQQPPTTSFELLLISMVTI